MIYDADSIDMDPKNGLEVQKKLLLWVNLHGWNSDYKVFCPGACGSLVKSRPPGCSDMGQTFHKTLAVRYPRAKLLPLPNSMELMATSEMSRFSPNRLRDINGSLLSGETSRSYSDSRIRSYDCSGSVSLSAHMQTNVPTPCRSQEHFTHFNMPGGLWGQGDKYLAEDHLISKARSMFLQNYSTGKIELCSQGARQYSTNSPDKPNNEVMTRAQKLKTAVKEYGSVVIVFHVGISLLSLGGCYLLVTR